MEQTTVTRRRVIQLDMFYNFQPERQQAVYRQFCNHSIIRKQTIWNLISYSSSTYGMTAIYQPNFPTHSLWQDYHHKVNKIQFWRIIIFTIATSQLKKTLWNKECKPNITSTYPKQNQTNNNIWSFGDTYFYTSKTLLCTSLSTAAWNAHQKGPSNKTVFAKNCLLKFGTAISVKESPPDKVILLPHTTCTIETIHSIGPAQSLFSSNIFSIDIQPHL